MIRNKKWRWVGAVLLVALLVSGIVAYKVWNKPHRDVIEEVGIGVTAQDIFEGYANNEKKSDSLYLNKAIEVVGQVSEVSKTMDGKTVISMRASDPMGGVRCTMKEKIAINRGETIKIKGICTGFLMDVTLIDCYLIK